MPIVLEPEQSCGGLIVKDFFSATFDGIWIGNDRRSFSLGNVGLSISSIFRFTNHYLK